MSLIPGLGRSSAGGHGNPLQYSSLENPMDRGAWWATAYRAAKSQSRLKQLSMRASYTWALSISSSHFGKHCPIETLR